LKKTIIVPKPTYLIDTNIFLRTLIKEDEVSFQACQKFLNQVKTNQVEAVVPGVVLIELVWTLKSFYGLTKREVIQALESVLHLNNLKVIDDYDHAQALKLWSKHKAKYVDCLLASLAQKYHYYIISYDQDFEKLGVKLERPF